MSDKKISQLPASTTPLAGTEELALVQSGDTKKVTVANLTAGRAVSAASFSPSSATKPANGMFYKSANAVGFSANSLEQFYYDTSNFGVGTSQNGFFSWRTATKNLAVSGGGYNESNTAAITLSGGYSNNNRPHGWSIKSTASGTNITGTNVLSFEVASYDGAAATSTSKFKMEPINGNLIVEAGNLVIGTSGKGIDFSADGSAAGMTSELLDDYEEGTFTPVLSDSSGNNATAGFSGGVYTKIGRVISFQLNIININTAGLTAGDAIRVSLPFASFAGQYGSTSVRVSVIAFTTLPVGYITPNAAYLNLFEASSGAAGANVLVSALTNGQSDIMISGTYQTN